jgi:hypothetical protein
MFQRPTWRRRRERALGHTIQDNWGSGGKQDGERMQAMAEGDESGGLTELAMETVAPIEQELRRRVTVELGERDIVAIESALLKAFLSGMQAGAAETADAAVEQDGMMQGRRGGAVLNLASLDLPLPRLDPWAARYGDG